MIETTQRGTGCDMNAIRRYICGICLIAAGCATAQVVQTTTTTTQASVVSLGSSSDDEQTEIISGAWIPKQETGAVRFLTEHETFDGRGVVIAIFDTGVDPGAPGLQVTTEGKKKIVDVIDATGSGDVDTSTVKTIDADGTLAGLTGRSLIPDPGWHNPSGEYHLGMKSAFDIMPRGLVGRMKRERRRNWDQQQRELEENLRRALINWDEQHSSPTDDEQEERDDLDQRLAGFHRMQGQYEDPGPIYDCLVFFDGQSWRAALDTDEDGEFSDETLLTNYRDEQLYATLGDVDLLNYVLNIYEDGNLLSIVADSGSHGTHVAGITAAYFPDQPELNGMAPGAQLVAVKIGDTRMGSTSLGTGEVRGTIAVAQNNCDLINMSFGGPGPLPDEGRIVDIFRDVVNEQGVIFVASAGNAGPALSTVGGPGGTTSEIFGVGAVITPDMMRDQYSLRDSYDTLQYTFSSRGPTVDGDLGVVISAPGGAIAPVPNWVLQKNAQMHGTSMSAPNACGGLALLLSGLKQEEMSYSPHTVRRAIQNTAQVIEGTEMLAQGPGMLQIDRAWDYLCENEAVEQSDVRFEVTLTGRENARGLYLREPFENDRPFEGQVTIKPVFPRDIDQRIKVDFELLIDLEPTEPWIEVADRLMLMHGGRRLSFRVDPTGLPDGVHYAEIRGIDAQHRERGAIFQIPVTVVRTIDVPLTDPVQWQATTTLIPGEIYRQMIAVPPGATWADLKISRVDEETARRLVVQVLQLRDEQSYAARQAKQYVWFDQSENYTRSFAVEGDGTLELAVAHYWSSLGDGEFDLSLTFHGIEPSTRSLMLDGGALLTPVDVTTILQKETIAPRGSLSKLRKTIRSDKSEVFPLNDRRDQLPENRLIYELINTYSFKLDSQTEITINPALNTLSTVEDIYESQLWMIFDQHRRRVAMNYGRSKVKLPKGKYTLRYHLRHDNPEHLAELDQLPLFLDHHLKKTVSLKVIDRPAIRAASQSSVRQRSLAKGETERVYFVSPKVGALPKIAQPGDLLMGTVTYGTKSPADVGQGNRPGGYPVAMTVPPALAKQDQKGSKGKKKDAPQQGLNEKIRSLRIEQLDKLMDEAHRAEFDALAAELLQEQPDDLRVLVKQLDRADTFAGDDEGKAVIEAADRIISLIDQDAVAAYFGIAQEEDDQDADQIHKEMELQRDSLINALDRKVRTLLNLAEIDPNDETIERFDDTWHFLGRWEDTSQEEYLTLRVGDAQLHDRLGDALKIINDHLESSDKNQDDYELRMSLLRDLGWDHLLQQEERWMLLRFPRDYPLF